MRLTSLVAKKMIGNTKKITAKVYKLITLYFSNSEIFNHAVIN